MERFDVIKATFSPKRTADLRPGAADLIGTEMEWQAVWIIEDGDYEGQWAMMPTPTPTAPNAKVPFVWAPECDLEAVPGGVLEELAGA